MPVPLFVPVNDDQKTLQSTYNRQKVFEKKTSDAANSALQPQRKMSLIFETTIEEIFNKFDVEQLGVLTYPYMLAFCNTVERKMKPSIWNEFLVNFNSTQLNRNSARMSTNVAQKALSTLDLNK